MAQLRPRLHGNGPNGTVPKKVQVGFVFTRELMEPFQAELLAVPKRVHLGCVYTWSLEQFYMEPFRRGMNRLPVYPMSWNRFVQNRFFPSIHSWMIPHSQSTNYLPLLQFEAYLTRTVLGFYRFLHENFWVPNGTYILSGPVWVRLSVLFGTV